MAKLYLGSELIIDPTTLVDTVTLTTEINSINTSISDINTSLTSKVDAEDGKGLSSNDFTDELLTKLDTLNTTNFITKDEVAEFAKVRVVTQSEYEAIETKETNVLYIIT